MERIQFSVKHLLVLLAFVAVTCDGIYRWRTYQARERAYSRKIARERKLACSVSRRNAAREQYDDICQAYRLGRVSLDLRLDAQRRLLDTEIAYASTVCQMDMDRILHQQVKKLCLQDLEQLLESHVRDSKRLVDAIPPHRKLQITQAREQYFFLSDFCKNQANLLLDGQ